MMKKKICMMTLKVKDALSCDQGQDLIEYALVVAVIAVAATTGMSSVASSLNTAFRNIGNKLVTYTG